MERKRMSNSNFCDTDFDNLGTDTDTINGATCGPTSDLSLSTLVMGNQEAVLSRLIMILLFLYAYTNQNFICHLMCVNEKMINNQMCLTDKMVDNLMDNLDDCNSNLSRCRAKHHNH